MSWCKFTADTLILFDMWHVYLEKEYDARLYELGISLESRYILGIRNKSVLWTLVNVEWALVLTSIFIYRPQMWRGNAFGHICLSVCLHCSNFESLDLESSFLVHGHIFEIFRSVSYIKVIGSRSTSQKQNSVSVYTVGEWSAFDWQAVLLVLLLLLYKSKIFTSRSNWYVQVFNWWIDITG